MASGVDSVKLASPKITCRERETESDEIKFIEIERRQDQDSHWSLCVSPWIQDNRQG